MNIPESDRTALEAFVLDNPELDKLESLLGQFNVFEALGAVRHELRHSDFLAFLLDPLQNHGLGDEFARLLLQNVLMSARDREFPVSLIDLSIWSLEEIEVYREWQNIDILLIDNVHKFAVIIENKIGSSEHSNQLQRYHQTVTQHFPQLDIIGIFLTPDGDIPSDDSYIATDYSTVCKVIEKLTEKRASTLGNDVKTLMTHYTQMLRRHIMSESEIADLCRRIYKKHKNALDLIFEHRPDQQAFMRDLLEELINNEPLLEIDTISKTLIRFTAREWDVPPLSKGQGWTKSGRILLFEIYIKQNELATILWIGPGPIETRQALLDMARNDIGIFRTQSKTLRQKYNSIYRKNFLRPKDFEEEQEENLEEKIKKIWNEFIQVDLPKILNAVRNNQALWQNNR
ncbi:MAG TPA: PD-(D/E)XK nuclease family protein [Pyrinomonadaceae bacterium]|nr:PD-(D/E)XK nuclease family protein [Pyrinomonadaceae bacterium]